MKIICKKNPNTCDELSVYLGFPVKSWVIHPDCSCEVDLDVTSLTTAQKNAIEKKVAELPIHFKYDWE